MYSFFCMVMFCSFYGSVVNGLCLLGYVYVCLQHFVGLYLTICFGFRVNEFLLAWFDCFNVFVLWTLILFFALFLVGLSFSLCPEVCHYWLDLFLVGPCIFNVSRSVWDILEYWFNHPGWWIIWYCFYHNWNIWFGI